MILNYQKEKRRLKKKPHNIDSEKFIETNCTLIDFKKCHTRTHTKQEKKQIEPACNPLQM